MFVSQKSLLMIVLGLFSLIRIGYHHTKIFKEIFQNVQLKRIDAIDVDDNHNCSCEMSPEGLSKYFRRAIFSIFLGHECHCEWKNRITQEEEESFKSGRNFWIYQDDYYRDGFTDFHNFRKARRPWIPYKVLIKWIYSKSTNLLPLVAVNHSSGSFGVIVF